MNLTDLGTFTDPGFGDGFTVAASIDWGDKSSATGSVNITTVREPTVATSGTIGGGSHAYNADGEYTVTVTVTDSDGGTDTESFEVYYRAPAAPTNVQATKPSVASNTTVDLSWQESSSDQTGFEIEKKSTDDTDFEFAGWAAANATSYSVTGLTAGTSYSFEVVAYNDVGPASSSPTASLTTNRNAPQAPTNLLADSVTSSTVHLTWTEDPSSEQAGFTVEESTDGMHFSDAVTIAGATSTSVTVNNLSPNTIYYFRVRAEGDGGVADSADSNVTEAETAPAAPAAPTDVTAIAEPGPPSDVRLVWNVMPALTVQPSGATLIQTDGGTGVTIADNSGTLPQVIAYAASTVGDDYTLSGDITFSTNSELGLLCRADAQAGTGYVLSFDPTTSEFKLVKLISATESENLACDTFSDTTIPTAASINQDISQGNPFEFTFEANGNALTGQLYDSQGILLDTIKAIDSSGSCYLSGSVGTWAAKKSGAIDGTWSSLHLSPSPLAATPMPTLAAWTSGDGDGGANMTFTQSPDGSQLYVEDGTPPSEVVGYADSGVGNDYFLSGNITFTDTTEATSPTTELGFVFRADVLGEDGYVLSLDPTTSTFKLALQTSTVSESGVTHNTDPLHSDVLLNSSSQRLVITPGETFKITLEVNGSSIEGKLYDAGNNLLDIIDFTDSTYSSGFIGTWALNHGGATEGTWSNMEIAVPAAGPDGYRIEQSSDGGQTFTEVATCSTPDVTVSNLAPDTQYCFQVVAYNSGGDSGVSNTATVTTTAATSVPADPTGLLASAVSSTEISLTWQDHSNNEAGFQIYQSLDGTSQGTLIATTLPNCTSWTVSGLSEDTYYYFRVYAYNNLGPSVHYTRSQHMHPRRFYASSSDSRHSIAGYGG